MSARLAIVINEQRLRQLMLEFLSECGHDGKENLMYELKFSEFMLWLQRKQRGGDTDGPNRNQRVISANS